MIAESGNKAVASVFRRGIKGLDLDEDEYIQFFALLGQFLNTWSVLYDLHERGMLPENQWNMVRKDIITMMSEPGGREFWEQVGRLGVHEDFGNAVDTLLSSEEVSYKIV